MFSWKARYVAFGVGDPPFTLALKIEKPGLEVAPKTFVPSVASFETGATIAFPGPFLAIPVAISVEVSRRCEKPS